MDTQRIISSSQSFNQSPAPQEANQSGATTSSLSKTPKHGVLYKTANSFIELFYTNKTDKTSKLNNLASSLNNNIDNSLQQLNFSPEHIQKFNQNLASLKNNPNNTKIQDFLNYVIKLKSGSLFDYIRCFIYGLIKYTHSSYDRISYDAISPEKFIQKIECVLSIQNNKKLEQVLCSTTKRGVSYVIEFLSTNDNYQNLNDEVIDLLIKFMSLSYDQQDILTAKDGNDQQDILTAKAGSLWKNMLLYSLNNTDIKNNPAAMKLLGEFIDSIKNNNPASEQSALEKILYKSVAICRRSYPDYGYIFPDILQILAKINDSNNTQEIKSQLTTLLGKAVNKNWYEDIKNPIEIINFALGNTKLVQSDKFMQILSIADAGFINSHIAKDEIFINLLDNNKLYEFIKLASTISYNPHSILKNIFPVLKIIYSDNDLSIEQKNQIYTNIISLCQPILLSKDYNLTYLLIKLFSQPNMREILSSPVMLNNFLQVINNGDNTRDNLSYKGNILELLIKRQNAANCNLIAKIIQKNDLIDIVKAIIAVSFREKLFAQEMEFSLNMIVDIISANNMPIDVMEDIRNTSTEEENLRNENYTKITNYTDSLFGTLLPKIITKYGWSNIDSAIADINYMIEILTKLTINKKNDISFVKLVVDFFDKMLDCEEEKPRPRGVSENQIFGAKTDGIEAIASLEILNLLIKNSQIANNTLKLLNLSVINNNPDKIFSQDIDTNPTTKFEAVINFLKNGDIQGRGDIDDVINLEQVEAILADDAAISTIINAMNSNSMYNMYLVISFLRGDTYKDHKEAAEMVDTTSILNNKVAIMEMLAASNNGRYNIEAVLSKYKRLGTLS